MAHPVVPLAPAWVGGDLSEADRILLFQHEFANCVVAAAPADAAAMLRTGPRSPEERRVVARISPALGPCLQTGKTFQLDAAILRALLAEALYRSARQWTGMASVAAGVKP